MDDTSAAQTRPRAPDRATAQRLFDQAVMLSVGIHSVRRLCAYRDRQQQISDLQRRADQRVVRRASLLRRAS